MGGLALVTLALLLGALLLVRGPLSGPARQLRIVTVPALTALTEELAATYRHQHPELLALVDRVSTEVEAGDRLRRGDADVAVLAAPRPPAGSRAIGWRPLVVAADSVLALDELSLRDLGRVFGQEVTVWSELGSASTRPIVPVERAPEDLDHLAFSRLVFGDARGVVRNALLVPDDSAARTAVEGRAGAIAYLGLRAAAGLRSVRIAGLAADPASIRSGGYPLTLTVFASLPAGGRSGYASGFAEFARSDPGQRVVDAHEVRL